MILDIWRSFRAMPLWVQVWVGLILVPVNAASILFWQEPFGLWIALLAISAMMLNLPIMLVERGFSKAMALPHVVIWVPLVIGVAGLLLQDGISGAYAIFLMILLLTDVISLLFDFKDAWAWLRGDREIAS